MTLRREVRRTYRSWKVAKIVGGICAAVLGIGAVTSRMIGTVGLSKLAQVQVDNVVQKVGPRWLERHPDKTCPTRHDVYDDPADDENTKDPWGHRIEILCDAGRQLVVVRSAGQDGVMGTSDDITSR